MLFKLTLGLMFIFLLSISFFSSARASGQAIILPNHSSYNSGYWYDVFGEVENSGDTPIENVQVTATFYNAENVTIAYKTANTEIDVLLSGRKAPFKIEILDTEIIPLIVNYSLKVSWKDCPLGKPIGLKILSNSSFIDTNGNFRILGEIQNTGDNWTFGVYVVATFYDENGTVLYTTKPLSSLALDPEEIGTFEIIVYDDDVRIALISSYSLTAESWDYAIIPEFTSQAATLMLLAMTTFAIFLKKKIKPVRA
jgi:hypothetical protein